MSKAQPRNTGRGGASSSSSSNAAPRQPRKQQQQQPQQQQSQQAGEEAAAAAAASQQQAGAAGATVSGDEVRLLVDWHHVGAIIGKGGASVREVREESGCAINIIAPAPNAPSPQQIDRIMTIKGDIDQTTKAIYLIARTIQQRAAERKKSGQEAGNTNERSSKADQADGTTAIKLLVHRAAVGAVIGRSGEAIRQTQAETGARIQVSSEPLGHSTDKTVTISGTPEVVQTAVHKVLTQLAESPLRAGTKTVFFVPGPAFYDYSQQHPHADGQHAPQQQAQAPQQHHVGNAPGPISIQKIAIPTICAGCVIGRGGSIIRDLRAQSGTNISIADPDPATPDERVVTITGISEGIMCAVSLIRQCVESYVPPAHAQGQDQGQEAQASGHEADAQQAQEQ